MNETQNTMTQAPEEKQLTGPKKWEQMIQESPWPHLKDQATRAFNNTSHYPERGAAYMLSGYAHQMESTIEALKSYKASNEDIAEFKTKFESKLRELIAAKSRCFSWMITGRSNFNTRRHEKANDAERNKVEAMDKWMESVITRHRRAYNRDNAMTASDYQAKVEELRAKHEAMKAVNRIIRSKKSPDEKAAESVPHLSIIFDGPIDKDAALKYITAPDSFGGFGFAQFELTNSLARIKAAEQRAKEMEARETTPDSEEKTIAEGVTVTEHPAENRIRIHFPGKPSDTLRTALKSSGFRWSPRNEAWQAYLKSGRDRLFCQYASEHLVKRIIEEYGEPSTD